MTPIEAVFRNGVFEPLGAVDLREDQRVWLSIEPEAEETPQAWLDRVRALQAAVVAQKGFLPDSSTEIAADRAR